MSAIKERPILFTGPMVRAILEGRKTETRRVVKPQPHNCKLEHCDGNHWIWKGHHTNLDPLLRLIEEDYGEPGDRVWVKETFATIGSRIYYRADGLETFKWRPSIFMRRDYSRITLEIVSVRVERLREITEQGAKAEGIEGRWHPKDPNCWTWKDYIVSAWAAEPRFHYGSMVTPVSTFEGLWDSINIKTYPWASNPWVWVIQFKRV